MSNQARFTPHHSSLIFLLLLAGLLFFLGLGTLGLTDRDEGSNAEAAREMLETGEWISPTLNYEPRFAKPVFIYWLMSGSYRLFGVSEFTARLPSALFGIALILLQYFFLARLRGPDLGLLASLMLLLNIEIVAIGRMALTDSVLIFFTTLSLFGFWLGLRGSTGLTTGGSTGLTTGGEDRSRHYMWLFYAGMAIGTLTKGPVGVAVPLLAVVPYLTLTGHWNRFWQRGFPVAGLCLFLVLAAPWYAAMLAIHGSRYTASAQADTIGRFLNVIGGHGGTVFFYIPVLFFGFFPWSGFLPAALWQAFKDRYALRVTRDEEALASDTSHITHNASRSSQELELFAALWVAGVFLFFSLSATRLPHYIAPLFPAAALLTASYWHRMLTRRATPGIRASFLTLMTLGYLLGLALAASPLLYQHYVDVIAREFPFATQLDPGLGPPAAGLLLLVGMAVVGYCGFSERRRALSLWVAGGLICVVMLIAIQITLPRFSRYFIAPPQELAYTAGLNLGPNDRLILYGPHKPSLIFYAKRKAIVIKPGQEDQMRPHLIHPGRTMVLLPARLKPQLPAEAAGFTVVLQRFGYLLLSNEPMVREGQGHGAMGDR